MLTVKFLEFNPVHGLTVSQAERDLSLVEGEEIVDLRPLVLAEFGVQGETRYNELMEHIYAAG